MTVEQILSLGPALVEFLDEFADCFGRSEPREHLRPYVRGQLSNLQRTSVEPIAWFNTLAPRTLQEFLNSDVWDHPHARDRVQQLVTRDHEDPKAIGSVDDSGHPKSGTKTPGVQGQYGGRLGKTANGVVTVELAFSSFATRLRTPLDTELFLPESWSNDRPRCRDAGLPEDVVYRPKQLLALELLDRAETTGVPLEWLTADSWYSEKPAFLAGLEQRHRRYVVEIPRKVRGWLSPPGDEPRPPARGVAGLCRSARPRTRQPCTLSQVREAANALVRTLPFDAEPRARYLERAAAVLGRTQARNQKARRSHFKTRRRRLHELGLFTSRLRSCIPP